MPDFKFHLEVVTPMSQLFSGSVKQLVVRGSEGDIGVYKGHAPLLTAIKPCMLSFQVASGETELLYVAGGRMEIQPNATMIMADVASRASELDEKSAQEAKQYARDKLRHCHKNDCLKFELEVMKALAQLRVIETYKLNLRAQNRM